MMISSVLLLILTESVDSNHPLLRLAKSLCFTYPATRSLCKNNQGSTDYHAPYCYLKKTYTANGLEYDRGSANEAYCRQNQAYSSVNNPSCLMTNPPVGTVCFDCCRQVNCHPGSRNCNQGTVINIGYMSAFMKIGPSTETTHTTNTPTTPLVTTVPVPCEDKPGVDCTILNTTNICASVFADHYCARFCGHCSPSLSKVIG